MRTIAEVEGTGVKAWRRAQWQEQILVPALPQSALPGCSLIHIDYYLQVWCCPGLGGLRLGDLGLTPQCPHSFQVSLKAPEATVTLPLFVGNIAVNQTPLSPCPGTGSSPGALSSVVPSAPPQEDAEAVASGPQFSDPVSLSTKSHSQQQPLSAALGSVSVDPCVQAGSPGRHSLHPPLCVSIGATVPYFAEGSGGPVPTTSALILPPEYSSWGYPYGEWK